MEKKEIKIMENNEPKTIFHFLSSKLDGKNLINMEKSIRKTKKTL
jgi:hypothetical protein